MNIRKMTMVALFAAAVCGLSGCWLQSDVGASPEPIEHVSVSLAPGRTLSSAVMAAASRRRWLPQAQADGSIRCTLSQRDHLVVVDVVPNSDGTFSIRMVQSNIPVRKYNQWANNLSREIVYQASH